MGCGASKTTVVVAGTESAPSPVPTKPSEVPESKAGGDQTPSNASSGTASTANTEVKKTDASGASSSDAASSDASKKETAVSEPSSASDAMTVVSKASQKGGVPAVLELLKEKFEESDYCWWSFDAMAGLCAGNDKARTELFEGGGIAMILDGMQRFPWDANVQFKGNWLLASMASSYSGELGSQGAVEMVIAGMRACEEDYQVQTSGVRCLQNLIAGNTVNATARVPMTPEQLDNRARARAAGAIELIQSSLDRNPEDGQLQYRGNQLLERLKEVEEEKVKTVAETDKKLGRGASSARLVGGTFGASYLNLAALNKASSANEQYSPKAAGSNGDSTNTLGSARSAGGIPLAHAPSMAKMAAAPGFTGVSGRVAAVIQASGIIGVIELLKAEKAPSDGGSGGKKDPEVARWCCDAIFTTINGNAEQRTKAFDAGGLDAVIDRLASEEDAFAWHEDLALKCCWALLAFAPAYALEIGTKGGIDALVKTMLRHSNHHDLQVAAVKLLSLLTIESSGENLKRARLANAITIVKTCVKCHPEDGTLQYRGVNLLERLEPGCTASMPKLNMVRSASMRAEEMVMSARSFARNSSRAGGPPSTATARGGVAGGVSDAEMQAANAKAIAEVDELAEQVEESDDEGGEHQQGQGGGAKRRNSKVSAPPSPAQSSPALPVPAEGEAKPAESAAPAAATEPAPPAAESSAAPAPAPAPEPAPEPAAAAETPAPAPAPAPAPQEEEGEITTVTVVGGGDAAASAPAPDAPAAAPAADAPAAAEPAPAADAASVVESAAAPAAAVEEPAAPAPEALPGAVNAEPEAQAVAEAAPAADATPAAEAPAAAPAEEPAPAAAE